MKNLAWIAFWLLTGCVLCGTIGCKTDNSMKIVTDIDRQGEVSWHTEYKVEW